MTLEEIIKGKQKVIKPIDFPDGAEEYSDLI